MVFLLMQSLGEMSSYLPVPGAFETYATRFVSPSFGFALGWNYWFNWAITVAAELAAASIVMACWWPGVPGWMWSVGFLALLFLLNVLSARAYGESEFWFAIIKVTAVIVFLVLGILMIAGVMGTSPGLSHWRRGDAPFVHGFGGILTVFLIAGFSFQGTELIGIAAGESKDPRMTIPKATRQIFWRIMIFYIGSIVVITMALPFSQIQEADAAADSPFTLVLEAAKIPFAAGFMEAIIALALLSAFNAQIYATSRLVFDMAKDHCAPKFFLKTNHSGSPINAVILSMIFAFASVGLQFWNPPGLLAFLFNAVGGCLLVVWAFIVASFLKLHPQLKANGELTDIRVPGYPWLPWATAAALAALTIFMLFDPSARNQVIAVIILFAALVALSFVVPAGKREQVRQ